MNKMTKKTAFGITGAAAATLLVAGFAAPAMADDTSSFDYSDASTTATSISDLFRTGDTSAPVVLAPSVDTGDIANVGGVLNGNALLSGNEVNAPVASGNETGISDIGNGTSVSGGDVSLGDVGTSVDDLVDGGDIGTNVDNLVGDILADLGIED